MKNLIRTLVFATILGVSMANTGFAQNMGMDILTKVNGIRTANGLKPLRYDTNLDAPALVRATEASTFFSHTRPNGTEWYTVNANLMYGENLAEGYTTADEVVNAWMASPEHKANILRPDFTTMGIGIVNKNGKNYWAQIFGMG